MVDGDFSLLSIPQPVGIPGTLQPGMSQLYTVEEEGEREEEEEEEREEDKEEEGSLINNNISKELPEDSNSVIDRSAKLSVNNNATEHVLPKQTQQETFPEDNDEGDICDQAPMSGSETEDESQILIPRKFTSVPTESFDSSIQADLRPSESSEKIDTRKTVSQGASVTSLEHTKPSLPDNQFENQFEDEVEMEENYSGETESEGDLFLTESDEKQEFVVLEPPKELSSIGADICDGVQSGSETEDESEMLPPNRTTQNSNSHSAASSCSRMGRGIPAKDLKYRRHPSDLSEAESANMRSSASLPPWQAEPGEPLQSNEEEEGGTGRESPEFDLLASFNDDSGW